MPKWLRVVLPVIKKIYIEIFPEILNLEGNKSLYWFKSYGDFAEWVDFAYWWSCIGKGLPCSLYSRLVKIPLLVFYDMVIKQALAAGVNPSRCNFANRQNPSVQ